VIRQQDVEVPGSGHVRGVLPVENYTEENGVQEQDGVEDANWKGEV
jgi:hypothetical protein